MFTVLALVSSLLDVGSYYPRLCASLERVVTGCENMISAVTMAVTSVNWWTVPRVVWTHLKHSAINTLDLPTPLKIYNEHAYMVEYTHRHRVYKILIPRRDEQRIADGGGRMKKRKHYLDEKDTILDLHEFLGIHGDFHHIPTSPHMLGREVIAVSGLKPSNVTSIYTGSTPLPV